ncbi:LLM class flavin-dependent oxidoreductase [Ornithinimicrobium cavernae]|uniref:LLM class flavin-dependent oxidoreductase n=1 Tax=Ornithinimicrobium cavernae TaxID=2666047 RepID=UPI000D69C998|nr:LLM class flavin-dependent oxidoreductase [Ornithinimicrobium cavernae]
MTPTPPPLHVGLLLCSQFPVGTDPVPAFEEQLDQVRLVRDAGFGSVFTSQHYLAHPFQYLHPLAVLARIIPELGDMRMGTAISLLALQNPVDLAEQTATLDILSDGRLTLGVGLGYRDVEFAAFGMGTEGRLRRFLDNLDLVRALWTQDRVTFEADHVRLDDVPVALRPVQQPHPPIWMAAHTDAAIRRAARRGLPWVAAAAHVEDDYLAHQVGVYRDACAEYEHPDLDLPVMQEVYVAPTEEQALEVVRRSLAVKYEAYAQWGQDQILPESQSFDKEFDQLRQGRFLIGDPAGVLARIRALQAAAQPTHLLLRMQWPGMTQSEAVSSMELFAEQVLPHLETSTGKDSS